MQRIIKVFINLNGIYLKFYLEIYFWGTKAYNVWKSNRNVTNKVKWISGKKRLNGNWEIWEKSSLMDGYLGKICEKIVEWISGEICET